MIALVYKKEQNLVLVLKGKYPEANYSASHDISNVEMEFKDCKLQASGNRYQIVDNVDPLKEPVASFPSENTIIYY